MEISKTKVKSGEKCFHCGDECINDLTSMDDKIFCCQGCKLVYELLDNHGMGQFYALEKNPGVSQKYQKVKNYEFLDDETIKRQLLTFISQDFESVELMLPAIHCSSCIWLLENLMVLDRGIINVTVNFVNKSAFIRYNPQKISLRDLASLLSFIGYPPDFTQSKDKEFSKPNNFQRTLAIKIGIAGFCFGNIMLLSFPEYLGFTGEFDQSLLRIFGFLALVLSIPVITYCSWDYFKSAMNSLLHGFANIDIPISIGILTLFSRSVYEVITQSGFGYFDSLSGLLFFLLIGKWLQHRTYTGLRFDRDYRSYFPISVFKSNGEDFGKYIPIEEIQESDHLFIRNEEIIPTDGKLLHEAALIDYSFVTGESKLVTCHRGETIYAGGKLMGKGIKLEVLKKVNQSYLTELWNNKLFEKPKPGLEKKLIDKVSKYFTLSILFIASLAGVVWYYIDSGQSWLVFTAVLIIACPCALVLAIPFTYGNVMSLLGRLGMYLKNVEVVEKLCQIDTIVFDKTGTISGQEMESVRFVGKYLTREQRGMIHAVVVNSTHPLSCSIARVVSKWKLKDVAMDSFKEVRGQGIVACLNGMEIKIGRIEFVSDYKLPAPEHVFRKVHVAINEQYLGYYQLKISYRSGLKVLFENLLQRHQIILLSGDHEGEKQFLQKKFLHNSTMLFNQSPHDKLDYIKGLQKHGKKTMMVGDGLNDSGALQQSDIGLAICNDSNAFTPASDIILPGDRLKILDFALKLARYSRKIVLISFVIAILYNVIGIGFAISGRMDPLVAAILMPLSSISIVLFTTLSIQIFGYFNKINRL